MQLKDYIEFANKVKSVAVATLEGDQPRVRMLAPWFADETGFYFQIWTFKAIYNQLKENPKIELCFFSEAKDSPYSMMRVAGEAEFLEDKNLKEKVWQDRPFLKGLGGEGPEDPRLVLFRIAHGKACFWPSKKGTNHPDVEEITF